jgi:P4 family phage/plasmid primase-like protien
MIDIMNVNSNGPVQKLQTFLDKYEVKGDSDSNYTNMNPRKKYMIPDGKKFNIFIKLYTRASLLGNIYSITQKHKINSYFILDLDFKFPIELDVQRVYTFKHIKKIVSLCNRQLLNYLKIKNKNFLAFVMEKKTPHVRKGYSCDGIHIVYPYIGFHTNAHFLVINDIVNEAIQENLFKGLPHLNPIEKIFDTDVVFKNNWMLYGSCKPDSSPYLLKYIFNHKLEKIMFKDILLKNLPDKSLLDGVKKSNIDEMKLTSDHLPTLLSIPYVDDLTQEIIDTKLQELKHCPKKSKKKNKVKNELKEFKNPYAGKPVVHIVTKGTMKNIIRAQKLVNIISTKRASNYADWINVGIALHNVDYSLLDTWIEFSKKCIGKYRPGECEQLWEKFDKYGYALGSLFLWAKDDNPRDYKKFRKSEIKEHLVYGLTGTKFDIATVIHELYKHEFACASIVHKDWFQFRKNRWFQIEEGYTLDYLISTEVFDEFSSIAGYYFSASSTIKNGTEKDKMREKAEKATKIMSMLKDTTHKEKIMKECKKLFFDEKFYKKLDENRNLLGVENGIIDLLNDEFRPGLPEDYVTLCTNVNYIPYDEKDPKIIWVRDFLRQIQPNPEMRKYVVRLLSTFLSGTNPHEHFHIWTGTGCFALNTKIMMFDGISKSVQDIKVNDIIMGHDGTKKRVSSLTRNNSEMFKITPISDNKGIPYLLPSYVVNSEHKLVLKACKDAKYTKKNGNLVWWEWKDNYPLKKESKTEIIKTTGFPTNGIDSNKIIKKGDEFIITIVDWLKILSTASQLSNIFYGYRVPIEMDDRDNLHVNPYLIGIWIMLGSPFNKSLNAKGELKKKLIEQKYITGELTFTKKIRDEMIKLKLFESNKPKRIPERYLCSSIKTRKRLIKGIKDAVDQKINNYYFSNEELVSDICKLFNSVGYMTTYIKIETQLSKWKFVILGKQLLTKLKIRSVGNGNYYGFELAHDDSRFLLNDFTVVSNSNGKSKLITLFQSACGDYCDTLPVSLLTKKRGQSGAASPEVAKTKGKRLCVMQEPEEEDKLNEGLMKEITGNDEIEARKLYKEPIKFRPQFKIVLTCNRKPTITATDGGTWRRIRLVEFKSEFVDNPDPKKPYQFKIDRGLNEKLHTYAEAFLSILVYEYKQFKKEGLVEPKAVTEFTNEYKLRSDTWLEFINDNLCDTKDDNKIPIKNLYNAFKNWYKISYAKSSNLSSNDLRDYLVKHDFIVQNNNLIGYNYKTATKNVENEDDD